MGLPSSPMFCSGGNCYLLWWTFLPVNPLFAYLGSLLIPMTFALRGVEDLYTTWQGIGWFASEGQGCERDMHEVGAWESQQFCWNRASYVACCYRS
jgi:hypothetical protein